MTSTTFIATELPLFDFFQSIRDYERNVLKRQALTSDEYEWGLQALENPPFPLRTKDDLYEMVKLLWFKPYHAGGVAEPNADTYFKYQLFDPFWENVQKLVATEIGKEKKTEPEAIKETNTRGVGEGLTEEEQTGETGQADEKKEKPKPTPRSVVNQLKSNDPLTPYWVTHEAGGQTPNILKKKKRNFTFLEKAQMLPLDARRLYQFLFSIRHKAQTGTRNIFDLPGTIGKFAQQGYLEEFAFNRRTSFEWRLNILLDHLGSMAAFTHIGEVIHEFIQQSNSKHHIWYFQNVPKEHFFANVAHSSHISKEKWLQHINKDAPAQVLVFSDAGAARGGYNPDRVRYTKHFLQQLKGHEVVWMNPMPKTRWANTSAAAIELEVPMFETSDAGFKQAIHSLKMQG